MKIWLLNPYGPLPDEGWRKYRNILLGEELASTGNEVTWFASRFSHHFKSFRKGSGYKTNVRCFNVEYIEQIYEEHLSLKKNHQMFIWQIVNIELWFRMFF